MFFHKKVIFKIKIKGKRPHPNEIAGSDLDGDMYFILYDESLIDNLTPTEPMNYTFPVNDHNKKDKIELTDIIDFFADYMNFNNVGMIADAHIAHACFSNKKAFDEKSLKFAELFAKAVDAPKTGDKIKIESKDMPKEYPLFLMKNLNSKKKYRNSGNILDKLYIDMKNFLESYVVDKNKIDLFDKDLIIKNGYETFLFEAFLNYYEYYKSLAEILKMNEISSESELLTGNSDEYTGFQKMKHNYDIKEQIEWKLEEIFANIKKKFLDPCGNLKFPSDYEELFNSKIVERAEAHYIICYNFPYYLKKFSTESNQLLNNFYDLANKYKESKIEHSNLDYITYIQINKGIFIENK